jgi:hypothetical protein
LGPSEELLPDNNPVLRAPKTEFFRSSQALIAGRINDQDSPANASRLESQDGMENLFSNANRSRGPSSQSPSLQTTAQRSFNDERYATQNDSSHHDGVNPDLLADALGRRDAPDESSSMFFSG